MTAPFEIEEPEPEPVPFSGLLRTRCRRCRTAVALAAPGQEGNAMCGPCRLTEASGVTAIQRLPIKTPPSVEWAEQSGSQGASVPCPVCVTTQVVSTCTYAGHVKPAAPEFVCPKWGCRHECPKPVSDLWDFAYGLGWSLERRHSRGKPAGARTVSELWSVRFRQAGWAGYAVRVGDTWKSVAVSGEALPPLAGVLGVTELREWLADPDQPPEWYAKIKQRRAEADLASKTRACPGPGECAWVDEKRGDHTHRANGDIKIKNSRREARTGL